MSDPSAQTHTNESRPMTTNQYIKELEAMRGIYADAAFRWWYQARQNNIAAWAHLRNFERALQEAEDLTRERDEWKARCLTSEASEEDAQQAAAQFKRRAQAAWANNQQLANAAIERPPYKDDLRRKNARYRDALLRIMPLARSVRLLTGADRDVLDMAVSVIRIVDEALTEAKTGQQIWPPVVESANDSREEVEDV